MIEKLSPQELRKKMIFNMVKFIVCRKDWIEVKRLKGDFMFQLGASRFKTDEYFELCETRIQGLEFNEDRTMLRMKPKEETVQTPL